MSELESEALRIEAARNIIKKQRAFFSEHPGAALEYRSPKSKNDKHQVVIHVGTRTFRAEEPSYEDALTTALETAMGAYYRWHLARQPDQSG